MSAFSVSWPSSALIRDKYMTYRDRSSLVSPVSLRSNGSFDQLLKKLHLQLLQYYTGHAHFENDFRHIIHDLYKLVVRDESKVFALFQHDVLLLLARVDISRVPSPATADFIGVFDLLLSELTKRYDDFSPEFEYVLQRTSKIMGVFLISCLEYKRLPAEKVELISVFVLKLTQYYLTLTELVDYWFTFSLTEPDIMYLVTTKRLPTNVFPIYELAKDFLFMDDSLTKSAKDTLLHVILISCFSNELEKWVLLSDFPGLILAGLLSIFNKICYNDTLSSIISFVTGDSPVENPSFEEFDGSMGFVMDLISYASHDTIKIAFLSSFHNKFVIPLMFYFRAEGQCHLKVLTLFTYTLERLVIPTSTNEFTNSLIVDFLIEKCFINESENIINLYIDTLSECRDTTSALVPLFKLLSIVSRTNAPELLLATLYTNPLDTTLALDPQALHRLASEAKSVVEKESSLEILLTGCIDVSFKYLNAQLATLTQPRRLISFDSSTVLGSVICLELYLFFNHMPTTNEQLIRLLMDLVNANTGYVTNFLCENPLEDSLFFEIFDYLCECHSHYDRKLRHGVETLHVMRPNARLLASLKILHPVAQQRLRHDEHNLKVLINLCQIQLNVDLFKIFVVRFYAAQRASLALHKIKYSTRNK
ncbi:CYFA0S06e04302g1_1 [Cyberlindnera fabianii]|uniref:CYFA0S06e04302g1_1 n=1 Tax=Cyberlindnera fabianii TaxID=36022 RepID=A0A061AVL4_CYBFA|nr:CYFA0S06e04302g1_1 [Cyberlindnera fabianii]